MRKAWRKIPKEVDTEKEEQIRQEMEKSDMPAMLLASFLTIFLPVVVILLLLSGLIYWLVTML